MGTEREFDALASEAIAASEKEFFAEAMGKSEAVLDESGDTSLEDMGEGLEGQHEPDEEADKAIEAKAEDDDGVKPEKSDDAARDEQGKFRKAETPAERGLRSELTDERRKRQAVEEEFTKARADREAELKALEQRLQMQFQQQLQALKQPQQQPEPKAEEIPDRWTDPEGFDRYQREKILAEVRAETQQMESRRMAWSFEEATRKHGDAFKAAYAAADSLPAHSPEATQLLTAIRSSYNPGERLVEWHKGQLAMREIGPDPAAWKERQAAELREQLSKDPEFRKQLLADLQAEARGGAANPGKTAINLPPSLSSSRGGSASRVTGGVSDAEIFSEVMGR